MRRMVRVAATASLAAACTIINGCGAPNAVKPGAVDDINLRLLGDLYRAYTLAKKAPPTKVADFREQEAGYPSVIARIRDGDIQVYWGGQLVDPESPEPGSAPSDKVLAYASKVPKEGGPVLLANRTIKTMTPDEFQAAPKAAAEAFGAAPKTKAGP